MDISLFGHRKVRMWFSKLYLTCISKSLPLPFSIRLFIRGVSPWTVQALSSSPVSRADNLALILLLVHGVHCAGLSDFSILGVKHQHFFLASGTTLSQEVQAVK
jgi:hypothetical protein